MNRGEIWWAALPDPQGSGPGFRRPVLVVQSDDFNRSRISTVICLVLTSNLALADAPGNVEAKKKETGLPKDSVVNVSQVITLDKTDLTECVGTLPTRLMHKVERGILKALSIPLPD